MWLKKKDDCHLLIEDEFLHNENLKPGGFLLSRIWLYTLRFSTWSGSEEGVMGRWSCFPFFLTQRISTLVSMFFCLSAQRSDRKECWPGELLLLDVSVGKNTANSCLVSIVCSWPAVTLNSPIQWPYTLTLANRPLPNVFNTPPQLLNSQLLYFWFAFAVAEWIYWLPFSFSVTDRVYRWL